MPLCFSACPKQTEGKHTAVTHCSRARCHNHTAWGLSHWQLAHHCFGLITSLWRKSLISCDQAPLWEEEDYSNINNSCWHWVSKYAGKKKNPKKTTYFASGVSPQFLSVWPVIYIFVKIVTFSCSEEHPRHCKVSKNKWSERTALSLFLWCLTRLETLGDDSGFTPPCIIFLSYFRFLGLCKWTSLFNSNLEAEMVIAKECWSFFVHFCVDFEVCLAHLSLLSVGLVWTSWQRQTHFGPKHPSTFMMPSIFTTISQNTAQKSITDPPSYFTMGIRQHNGSG